MKRYLFLLVLIMIPSMLLAAKRPTVRIGEVDGAGVSDDQLETVESLLEDALSNYADVGSGPDALRIDASLNRLDYTYILVVKSVRNGKILRSRRAKMADFDEVDTAVSRLVAALMENRSVRDTAERGKVLEEEQREPTQLKSVAGWEISVGGAWPLTDALGSHDTLWALGGGYLWDLDDWLIEIRGDFMGGFNDVDTSVTSISLGGHYIWKKTRKTALYSGLDAGFGHFADDALDGKSGFAVAGNVGALLFRHADINLDVRFRVMTLTAKFQDSVPVVGALMAGIHF